MAVYFVTGKLGAGKTIYCVKKMREYAARGSRVATNFDIFTDKLTPRSEIPFLRIPDHPRPEDLKNMGRGCPEEEKRQLGALFLDEMATWMNSRQWNDKNRPALLDWFIHARKLGWDVYFMVQDADSVDKQLLSALGEHFIECSRLDRFRVPIFSDLYDFYRLLKTKGREQTGNSIIPHVNKALTYYGKSKLSRQKVNAEFYKPHEYFGTYDTNQIFSPGIEVLNDKTVDMRASFSTLPGKTLNAWYNPDLTASKPPRPKITTGTKIMGILSLVFAAASYAMFTGNEPSGSPANASSTSTNTGQANPDASQSEPPLPPIYQNLIITGYMYIRKDGSETYDYAFSRTNGNRFDYAHYGLTLIPVSSCMAWLQTVHGQQFAVYCGELDTQTVSSSQPALQNFDIASAVQNAYDAATSTQ